MISQLRTAPNLLTLLRLAIIPFIVDSIIDHRYQWALALFLLAGLSDGLDGLLARMLKQRTILGEYLDPIADKLLLSTLFIELATVHRIPWRVTVLVFARDIFIVVVCALLYMTVGYRDFRPSLLGKLNTLAQITTVLAVLLTMVSPAEWIAKVRWVGLLAVMFLTVASGLHYAIRVSLKLRTHENPARHAMHV
jgi:cardiolipin synthase